MIDGLFPPSSPQPEQERGLKLDGFNKFFLKNVPNIFFMDTETSGLDGEVIEFSVVDFFGINHLSSRCKPILNFIDNGATAVHGIKLSDLKNSQYFYQWIPSILRMIGTSPVIMYNADFDTRIIMNSLELAHKHFQDSKLKDWDEKLTDRNFICLMKLISEYNKGKGLGGKWLKLLNASKQFGLEFDETKLHGSLYDTVLTWRIFLEMAGEIGNTDVARILQKTVNGILSNKKVSMPQKTE